MNTKLIGTWAYLIGLILALLTVFVSLGSWAIQALIILGILAGLFHHQLRDDLISLGVAYLALAAVAGSMGELVAIGVYVSDIAAAWVSFLGPVVLTAFMVWGTPRLLVKPAA